MLSARDLGILGDGQHVETAAIQRAIDALHAEGGGTLVFEPGIFLTGTLFLKSRVTLYLENGAVLKGSPDIADYSTETHYQRYDSESHMDRCLVFCEGQTDVAIKGEGTIHGNGEAFVKARNPSGQRPMLLRFLRSTDITLEGIALEEPAAWCTAFIECQGIAARGLRITSTTNGNGDGLDFDSCQDVTVSDCRFRTSDDAICLQNSVPGTSCRDVTITNCVLTSRWAGIRIGLLSSGDFEDVTVSNCIFHDMQCSGLKIQSTEGGAIRNMLFQNLVMRNVPRPIFITLNHFHIGTDAPMTPPRTGTIENLSFDHLRLASDPDFAPGEVPGLVFVGTPGHPIRDIRLTNVSYDYPVDPGRPRPALADLPEMEDCRPEYFVYPDGIRSDALFLAWVDGFEAEGLRLRPISRRGARATTEPPALAASHVGDIVINGRALEDGLVSQADVDAR